MVNIPSQDVYEYNACNAAFSLPHVGYPNLFQAIDFQSLALSFHVQITTLFIMIVYRFRVKGEKTTNRNYIMK